MSRKKNSSDENLERLRVRVLCEAKSIGLGDEAEDFFQEIMLSRLQGRGQSQLVKHATIDAARKQGFSTRDGKENPRKNQVPLDEIKNLSERIDSKIDAKSSVERYLKRLEMADRAVLILYFAWGLTTDEIAYVLGLKESLIPFRIRALVGGEHGRNRFSFLLLLCFRMSREE